MTYSNNRPATSAASVICNKLHGAGSDWHTKAEMYAIIGKTLRIENRRFVLIGLKGTLPQGWKGHKYGKLAEHMLNELNSEKGREKFLQRAYDVLAECAKFKSMYGGKPGIGALASQGSDAFFKLFPENDTKDEYVVPSDF